MASNSDLAAVDVSFDRSPVCKRACLDLKSRDLNRWSLSENEILLHSVIDSGIGILDTDLGLNIEIETSAHFDEPNNNVSIDSLYPKGYTHRNFEGERAALKASLSNDTTCKLSRKEIENFDLVSYQFANQMDYFNLLSDEIVLLVLKRLPRKQLKNVALVCRRFCQLTEDESLWLNQLDLANRKLNAGALGRIISRQVVVLKLANSQIKAPAILPHVKASSDNFFSKLMYLDLTTCTISTETLEDLLGKCQVLENISLENVTVNSRVLFALAGNTELKVLNCAMTTGIDFMGMVNLLSKCRKLTELNLAWTNLSAILIEYICQNLPSTLTCLNLSGCKEDLNDNNIEKLVLNCKNLVKLDLSDCISITDECIPNLLLLIKLQHLSLSRCYSISNYKLLLLNQLESLEKLDIFGKSSCEYKLLQKGLGLGVKPMVKINSMAFSSIARPVFGSKTGKIWNQTVYDLDY